MANKIIKALFPNMSQVKEHPYLINVFGGILHRQSLWHINRHSVSRGVAVGFFCAFIPLPIQMVIAALLAIVVRSNMAIAVISVWISNPITITPMFYFCYKLGALLLGIESEGFHFELSWEWLKGGFVVVWKPLLIGSIIVGTLSAFVGYFVIHIYWRYYVVSYWKRRSKLTQT